MHLRGQKESYLWTSVAVAASLIPKQGPKVGEVVGTVEVGGAVEGRDYASLGRQTSVSSRVGGVAVECDVVVAVEEAGG